jgi:hypothetical protein
MNSNPDHPAEKIIDFLTEKLSQERIVSEIDEPIYNAIQSFSLKIATPVTHSSFNHIIAAFVRHIFEFGLRLPRYLSDQQALSEAVSMLEKHYHGTHVKGYDGALLDAAGNSGEGTELVLSILAEAIKAVQRKKYVESVFALYLDHLDWAQKLQIVSAYVEQNGEYLPSHFLQSPPARFTGDLQDLIINHVDTDSSLHQLFSSGRQWWQFPDMTS